MVFQHGAEIENGSPEHLLADSHVRDHPGGKAPLPDRLSAALALPSAAGEIYVPDKDATKGSCNVYPWGSTTDWTYQVVVPTRRYCSR